MSEDAYLQPVSGDSIVPLRQGEQSVGRMADNDVHLDDSGVSRHHARIVCRGTILTVEDLGSTNGTRVNGQRVIGMMPAHAGDLISFGPISFVVRMQSGVESTPDRTPLAPPRSEPITSPFGPPLGPVPAFPDSHLAPLGPAPSFPAAVELPALDGVAFAPIAAPRGAPPLSRE